jgi:hypothetical protein
MRAKSVLRVGVLVTWVFVAPAARADVTGSFDGTLTAKKLAQVPSAAATFTQSGKLVTGTVALPRDLDGFGGEYVVNGTATPKKLKVSGGGPNGDLRWTAKIVGDTLQGKAKVKGLGGKLAGKLVVTRNVFTSDGSACDAVFTTNQSVFVDQVLGVALTACTSCHQPGLQAGSTRLHVLPADPLATARAVALMVDAGNPSASRLIEKPLNLVPHGGGLQLVPGGAGETALRQWIDLVAAAHCN